MNRKIPYIILGILAVALVSCSKQKPQAKPVPRKAQDTAPKEVLEEFDSPDLGLWQLTGPVSGASYYAYETKDTTALVHAGDDCDFDSLTFNREGLVTSMVNGIVEKGKKLVYSDLRFEYTPEGEFRCGREAAEGGKGLVVKLSRTGGGYLQVLQVLGPDKELSADQSYYRLIEWANGILAADNFETPGGNTRTKYHYNPEGLPDQVIARTEDMGGDIVATDTYTYQAFDKYGNWTQRRAVSVVEDTESEPDGTNRKTTKKTVYRLEKRYIYYYPPRTDGDAKPDTPPRR